METTRWHCTDQTVRPVPTFLPVSPDDTAHDHVVVLTRIRSTSMISFFRKLSIGGKIKDGILPQEVMGTAEDLSVANNPSSLILKTDVELEESVYDLLRTIKDPEKPQTLEQLDVVYEDCINVCQRTPRGLCIRVKLERHLSASFKLDIYIKKGAHATEQEINKQINDKERIAAAMENPNLRELVEKCIVEEDY